MKTRLAMGILCAMALAGTARGNVWNRTTGWRYGDPAAWNEGAYPSGQGAVADFSQVAAQGVTNDVSVTLGTILVRNAVSLVPGGSETITLDSAGGTCTVRLAASIITSGARIDTVLTGDAPVEIDAPPQAWGGWFGGLAFHGANTYGGNTYLRTGTFFFGTDTAGSAGAIVSGPVGRGTLYLDDGVSFAGAGPNYPVRTIANPLVVRGQVTRYANSASVRFTGSVTLAADAVIRQEVGGGDTWNHLAFDGPIGESGGARGLTVYAFATDDTRNVRFGGTNTFSGGLTVAKGKLVITNGSGNSAMTGPVTVRTNAVLELWSSSGLSAGCSMSLEYDGASSYGKLNLKANATVLKLYLGGARQAAGTYGSTSGGAANKSDNYFMGTGILTVLPPKGTIVALR